MAPPFQPAKEISLADHRPAKSLNVESTERVISVLCGAMLLGGGVKSRSLTGLGFAALGAGLVYRGVTGHCHLYQALGLGITRKDGDSAGVLHKGIRIDETIRIERPAADLYQLWRDFTKLPKYMKHVQSVTVLGPNRTRWTIKGPLDQPVEWDAEVYNERENELIAWRSLAGSEVDTAGSVHFREQPEGRTTEVQVVLSYDPPGGRAGAAAASMFGKAPSDLIVEDLSRFKAFAEKEIHEPQRH